tara:strand:+ start:2767 stop:3513 length:747 start_codon:yes stop_codon:yes gene_type:complete
MSKRLTDTNKWKKKWFRNLDNDYKVFWMYILDNCDHAGIWEVDFEMAEWFCKTIDEGRIRNVFEKQYYEFDNGKRWFLKDFIDFQYGTLNEKNRVHLSVINILKKNNLINVNKGLISPLLGSKDKDKDMDKDKEKDKKVDQIKKIKKELPLLIAEFPNVDVAFELQKWQDWMLANGKIYKRYKPAFKNWCRSKYVDEKKKMSLDNIKTDTTGFYMGRCIKCKKVASYDKWGISQDSRCCKAEICPVSK